MCDEAGEVVDWLGRGKIRQDRSSRVSARWKLPDHRSLVNRDKPEFIKSRHLDSLLDARVLAFAMRPNAISSCTTGRWLVFTSTGGEEQLICNLKDSIVVHPKPLGLATIGRPVRTSENEIPSTLQDSLSIQIGKF